MKLNFKLKPAMVALAGVAVGVIGATALRAQGSAPTAYLVAQIGVHDVDRYKTAYAPNVAATLAPFGGHYLAAGGHTEAVEGEAPPNRVVIIEFPNIDQAKAWYNSAEYGKLKPIRHAAATTRSFLVEGVKPH